MRWLGAAAVVVSVVHVRRGASNPRPATLDGKTVPAISCFLFGSRENADPAVLKQNEDLSYQGSIVVGSGFIFSDDDPATSPLSEMADLTSRTPANATRIFPYLGGEELNSDPEQKHSRYIINFAQMGIDEARRWPDLLAIVERKVRPQRATVKRDAHRERWWQYGDYRPGLYAQAQQMRRVLANSQVSAHHAFAFQPTDRVFSHALNIFIIDTDGGFAVLQGRPHEVWARFFASSMKDDVRYTPTDCFETFPLPPSWMRNPALNEVGKRYYDLRAALMVTNNEGLTKTYNRFHDPDHDGTGVAGRAPTDVIKDIVELRRLHDEMDRAVLDAYGWTDIKPTCEFLLDYEEDGDDEEEGGKRKKKKPWRYRWPDDVRDEVLARLLELNRQRAEEERLLGAEAATKSDAQPSFALEAPTAMTKKKAGNKKART